MLGLLRNKTHGEELPFIFLHPKPKPLAKRAVVWLDDPGKAALFDGDKPAADIQKLLDAGLVVVSVDLFLQGDFLAAGKPVTQTRRVKNPREFGGFTFGYNHSLFAQRVQDILTLVKFARSHTAKDCTLYLAGLGGAGPLAAAAVAQAHELLDGAVVDTGGFRFGKVLDLQDVNFLPGGAAYGDLPGMIALAAPLKLWLAGEGDQAPTLVQSIYAKASAENNLTIVKGDHARARAAALKCLLP